MEETRTVLSREIVDHIERGANNVLTQLRQYIWEQRLQIYLVSTENREYHTQCLFQIQTLHSRQRCSTLHVTNGRGRRTRGIDEVDDFTVISNQIRFHNT